MHPSVPPSPSSGDAARPRFCTSCGTPLGDGRFCGGCGSPADTASPTLPPVTVPAQHQPEQAPASQPAAGDAADTVVLPLPPLPPVEAIEPVAPAAPPAPPLSGLTWHDVPPDEPTPADEVLVPDEEQTSPPGRRRATVAVAGVLALVVLAGGGWAGVRYLQDGDVRRALAASTTAFNGVVRDLSGAGDVGQVAAAAATADGAADRVEQAAQRLSAGAGEAAVVRDHLEAEKAVLIALAALAPLEEDTLKTWSAAYAALAAAVEQESASRADLRRVRAGAASDLGDVEAMLDRLTATVSPALAEDATGEAGRLARALDAAEKTADLRSLATTSAAEATAARSAAQTLPEGEGKQVLGGYADVLAAVADLAQVDGESASVWKAARAEMAAAFRSVSASADAPALDVQARQALASADGVVAAATAAFADWRAKTDAAVEARAADGEDLKEYAAFFRTQTKSYEQLRQDLSTFTARVEDPGADVSYAEGYAFLSQAGEDRRLVRDTLVGTSVPDGAQEAHSEVVAAIDRAISAVQSAYDGLEQSQDCFEDCPYYRDTTGWQTFLSESDAISKGYARALTRWDASVVAAERAISNRPLPPKPSV